MPRSRGRCRQGGEEAPGRAVRAGLEAALKIASADQTVPVRITMLVDCRRFDDPDEMDRSSFLLSVGLEGGGFGPWGGGPWEAAGHGGGFGPWGGGNGPWRRESWVGVMGEIPLPRRAHFSAKA